MLVVLHCPARVTLAAAAAIGPPWKPELKPMTSLQLWLNKPKIDQRIRELG